MDEADRDTLDDDLDAEQGDELVSLAIGEEHAGQRLDQVLALLVPQHSRSQLQRLIKDGRVQVQGRVVSRASVPVPHPGVVTISLPALAPATPEAEDLPLTIVYEDSDLVVVDKPAGMVVHPAAGHAAGTLVNALLHHVKDLSGIGGQRRPGIVHRLDRGTSGLMVDAKNDASHAELARQFHDREIEKDYVALVWGVVQAGRRIEEPIGRDPVHRQKMSTRARRARTAVTRIARVEHLPGVTLAVLAIATGRTHQIRVHLNSIGHPVVGDALYGGVRRHLPADLRVLGLLDRPFLHAARLAFLHPSDGRRLVFEAPLPQDLQRVLDTLRARHA
jgi:23S rRNA pseudouridine1911/1915/1917 synthase